MDPKNCKTKHHCFKPDPSKYEEDLVALIKDVRKEFSDLPGGAKLPFSIGISGMEGWHKNVLVNASSALEVDVWGVSDNFNKYIIPAQLAVGDKRNTQSSKVLCSLQKHAISPGHRLSHPAIKATIGGTIASHIGSWARRWVRTW